MAVQSKTAGKHLQDLGQPNSTLGYLNKEVEIKAGWGYLFEFNKGEGGIFPQENMLVCFQSD